MGRDPSRRPPRLSRALYTFSFPVPPLRLSSREPPWYLYGMCAAGPSNPGRGRTPLTGVRILELGQLIAGPYCGQVLADFGADVIKVEAPGSGDPMRKWGTIKDGRSLAWSVIGRNKRCITADLRTVDGQQFARQLAADADVVIENFRPGTLERFNLGWDVLHELNPGLVLVRISGYGQDGPDAHRPGYGSIGEAIGGLRYITGPVDRPPSRVGVSLGDMLAGLHAALGCMMALRARQDIGVGQVVDVSIYESVLALTEGLVSEYAAAGVVRERSGSILPGVAPSNLYPTADGAYVLVAANQDTVFQRLCQAMGRPELATSAEYGDHLARGTNQAALDDLISGWTSDRSREDLLAALDDHAVPAGTVYTAKEMLKDPHFQHRESIIEVPDPGLGSLAMQNVAPKLSVTPGAIRWTGPALGQHDDVVRQEVDQKRPEPATSVYGLPTEVDIIEVGLRDGLQNEPTLVDTATKVRWAQRLISAGLRRLEVAAFVHPRLVPAMADAEAVMAALPRPNGVFYAGLVLNQRGLDRALACGLDEVNMVVCASDTFSQRNQNVSLGEALSESLRLIEEARAKGLWTTLTVGTAFGCPFEGEISNDAVARIVADGLSAGAHEICLADTIGVGVPTQVTGLAREAIEAAGTSQRVRFHFHNTRNTGFANVYAAMLEGVRAFDASIGGIGGCPFAPTATGNIGTEDLVYFLSRMGASTGADLNSLIDMVESLEQELGHAVASQLPRSGPFPT